MYFLFLEEKKKEDEEKTQILSMEKKSLSIVKKPNENWEMKVRKKSLKSFTIKKLYHVNVQPTVSSFIKEIFFPLHCILKNID